MKKAKVVIRQGGQGRIDWGNGHSDTFEYPANSAKNALGIQRENMEAKINFTMDLEEDEAARFFVQGGRLQYE